MVQAFWCVRPAIQDVQGAWLPDFPVWFYSVSALQTYGDLRVFGPDPAPGDHKHAQTGGCYAIGLNHYHQILRNESGSAWHQDYVGAGANDHSHVIPVNDTHKFTFVVCSDADYAQLLIDLPNLIECGHAIVTGNAVDGWVLGKIDNTAWDAATRTSWETFFESFGLDLPEKITNYRRLVRWMLAIFFNNPQGLTTDMTYRYTSVSP
jgi:hypothetical protein